jgi:hypothetical protein
MTPELELAEDLSAADHSPTLEHDGEPSDDSVGRRLAAAARHTHHEYAGDEDRPLGSYLGISAGYLGLVAAAGTTMKLTGRRLPRRFHLVDLALLAVGTHKAARLMAKDPVTSPLRAPVARFSGRGGPSEVTEEVRGEGTRHAVGELLTCPFCIGQWIATAGVFGLVLAPRTTRFIASTFVVVAGSDFLQLAYSAAQKRSE